MNPQEYAAASGSLKQWLDFNPPPDDGDGSSSSCSARVAMPPSIIASERCRQTFALDQIIPYPESDTCPICEVRGWLDFMGGNRVSCRACKGRFFIQQNVPVVAPATLEPESKNDVMAG